MGSFSKLDAVNHMLLYSGEHIVNHLEDDSSVDTAIAEKILEDNIMSHVMRGLVNNTFVKKYTTDTNGFIYLPSETLEVSLLDFIVDEEFNLPLQVSYKGGSSPYLWNVSDQTGNWNAYKAEVAEDKFTVEVVYNLEWEDIETPMQRGIMAVSARDYQMIVQGDAGLDQYLAQREVVYTAKGRSSDIHSKRRNFLMGDAGTRFSVRRQGPNSRDPFSIRRGY